MTSRPGQRHARPAVISVLSGKGGVGKSVISCNLADRVADLGIRTLLVDMDLHCGNVHVLCNQNSAQTIGHVLSGRMEILDACTHLNDSLALLMSPENATCDAVDISRAPEVLFDAIRVAAPHFDIVILDHASGRSDLSIECAARSDMNLITLLPELTSLSDGFGLYKRLTQIRRSIRAGILINRIQSEEEAQYIRTCFNSLGQQFLKSTAPFWGAIPEDDTVRRAVAEQRFVAQVLNKSAAATAFSRLSGQIVESFPALQGTLGDLLVGSLNHQQALADMRE